MRSAVLSTGALAGLTAIAVAPIVLVAAQNDANCVSLRGSTMCPAFQDAAINPSNLTDQYGFLENVTDAASFDSAFASYFNTSTEYHMEKIRVGLQCNRTGSNGIIIQWEKTFLCGQFAQQSYNAGCTTGQNNPLVADSDTCTEHSSSQQSIVDNPVDCAPTARLYPNHNETRITTLANDNATCNTWNNLVTNNQAIAVMGLQNEVNCGFGDSISAQLCASCDPSGNRTVAACCTAQNTTLSGCASFGFPGAAAITPYTSSSSSMSATSSTTSHASSSSTGGAGSTSGANLAGQQSNNVGLTKGQLAGILVGSIIGAILLGALLAFLLCGRKRRKNDPESHRMAGGAVYGAAGNARSSSGDKPWTQSEDGMSRTVAGSPEASKGAGVGGGAGAGSHNYLGLGALGAGAAGVGAAGAAAAAGGDRQSPAAGRPTSEALTSSSGGAEGRGTTVTSVRDQYTGQDIHVGEDVVAIYPYNASLNDEITLEPEQHVTILRLYDDGWALGRTADGQEGALPLVCVSSTKGDVPGRHGTGTGTGTTTGTSDDEGMTSGNEYTSSVDGAVTAEEGATSDARSNRSRPNVSGAAL